MSSLLRSSIILLALLSVLCFFGIHVGGADYRHENKFLLELLIGALSLTDLITLAALFLSVDENGIIPRGTLLHRFTSYWSPESVKTGKIRLCPTYWTMGLTLMWLTIFSMGALAVASVLFSAMGGNAEAQTLVGWLVAGVAMIGVLIWFFRERVQTFRRCLLVAVTAGFGYLTHLAYCERITNGLAPQEAVWGMVGTFASVGGTCCAVIAALCLSLFLFSKLIPCLSRLSGWASRTFLADLIRAAIDGTCVTMTVEK